MFEQLEQINSTINKIKQVLEAIHVGIDGNAELEPVPLALPSTEISKWIFELGLNSDLLNFHKQVKINV